MNSVQGADAWALPPLSPSLSNELVSSKSLLSSLVPLVNVAKVDDEEEDRRFMWCLAVMLIFATFIFIILVSRMRCRSARSKTQVPTSSWIVRWKAVNIYRCARIIKRRRYKRRRRRAIHDEQLAEKVLPRVTTPSVWRKTSRLILHYCCNNEVCQCFFACTCLLYFP